MILKKNDQMEFLEVDDENTVIFDPETGNTHFLDEIGADVLNILSKPFDYEVLVQKLSEMYDASVDEIQADVSEFINSLLEKKVVVAI